MPGFNPDKINIHDLTVEDPEQRAELPFDPETSITRRDWNEIHENLKDLTSQRMTECAQAVTIIDPKVVWDFDPYEGIRDFKDVHKSEGLSNINEWADLPLNRFKIRTKILFFSETLIQDNLTDATWSKMIEKCESNKKTDDPYSFLHLASLLKIINQEKFEQAKILDPEAWDKLNGWFGEMKERSQRTGDGVFDSGSFERFIIGAALMKILAAEETKATKDGIEVKMRKGETSVPKIPDMPEQRNF